MRRFVVYKQERDPVTNVKVNHYLVEDGSHSVDIKDGKRWRAVNWLEVVMVLAKLAIMIFGTKYKIKEF